MAKARSSRKKTAGAAAPAVAAAPPAKKGGLLAALLAAFIVFSAVEVYIVAQKTVRESKRPEFVMSWPSEYKKGLTSLGEYGRHIYGVDATTTGTVYKTDKANGKSIKVFQLPELVYAAVEDSKGRTYILDKKNTVHEYSPEDKEIRKIALDGAQAASWMEVDSKDNFYVVDSANSFITKYDPAFNKAARFGGRGEGAGNFTNLGKIYAGPNDDLYCVNSVKINDARIKIFDANGRFKKEWPVKNIAKFSNLENLAITRDGYVYINSFEGSKVLVFNNNGKFMGKFDTDKNKRFLITYPASITGAKDGLLYIMTHDMGVFKPISY